MNDPDHRRLVADELDLLSPDAVADPHRFFRSVRERDPIAWSSRHRAWLVTGHPELEAAFHDDRLSTERMASFLSRLPPRRAEAMARAVALLDGWMLFHEPPQHTRLRAPLRRQFTPRAIGALESDVRDLCDRLLDDLEAGGEGDLVSSFAHPLPAAVIGRLFGIPEHLFPWLREWSSRFGVVVFGATRRPDYEDVARAAGAEFDEHLGALLDERRSAPADDLVSALLATEGAEDGLTTEEILGACSLILFAGHDTTSSAIGSGTLALLAHPGEAERLREEPDVGATAVEEVLRFESPAKVMMRQVTESHDHGGHRFEAGDAVFLTILAANRDPRVFDDPDRLDLGRAPNPHLAFGHGHHFCLGAALARLELRIALTALACRFPGMRVTGEVEWKPNLSDRSAARIPVSVR